jgi:predicted TIM-barrel fold metal-dependent hydrolase
VPLRSRRIRPACGSLKRGGLADNFMWANDYPHAEGSWSHSAEAIERQMQHLDDGQRAKILGLNIAKMFRFDVDKLLARRRPADQPVH